ncbi:MAG: glycosyltransferase family 39 protein, partial [Candidatus Firestonebacteria bacterium]|nr:glycosyltransferase family 39 protein [Candidatus Firestonebacteria bacterium]
MDHENKIMIKRDNAGLIEKSENILKILLVLFAGYYIAAFMIVVISRIAFPFELEWMEGGVLTHVRRVLQGQSLYVKPSLEFVPFIYTPLYYYIAAVFSKIFGLNFFSLRLVSFMASIGSLGLIWKITKRKTNDSVSAFVAAGFFAACYKLSDGWYDLARVDALFIFLVLAAISALQRQPRKLVQAAVFSMLAFLTKQNALIFILGMQIFLALDGRKGFWKYTLICWTGILIAVVTFSGLSRGWFAFYVFKLPFEHATVPTEWIRFWTR